MRMRVFEMLTAVSLMAISVGYSAADEYEQTKDGRSFFFDDSSKTYGYWDEATQKWYYYENGKAHDWTTYQELPNIKLPQPEEHIAKNLRTKDVKPELPTADVKNSEPAVPQTRLNDSKALDTNEIAERARTLSRDFQLEKRKKFAKIEKFFKKGRADKSAPKTVDIEKANERLNVLMNDLYPMYKKARGPKAISNFGTKKNKKRPKEISKNLEKMAEAIDSRKGMNNKRFVKTYEDVAKEIGFVTAI